MKPPTLVSESVVMYCSVYNMLSAALIPILRRFTLMNNFVIAEKIFYFIEAVYFAHVVLFTVFFCIALKAYNFPISIHMIIQLTWSNQVI